MEKSRIKKTSYNIMALALYELVNFVCQLILPGLIIRTYGSAYNGLVSSITQFLKYIQILTLGIAGPTRVALYKSLAKNDNYQTSAIVNAHAKYMRKVGVALISYIAVLCVAYPLLSDTQFSTAEIIFLTIAIGVHSLAAYFFGVTYSTLLTADQRQYIYNVFKTGITASTLVISVLMIKASFSLQVVKLSSGLILLVGLILLNKQVAAKYQIDKSVPPDMSALTQRRDAMGHSIANIIHDSTDVAVLTVMCNVSLVSVYSVYQIVMNGLKQLLNIFTVGTEAVFGSMIAKNEKERLRKSFSCFEFLIGVFVSIIFSAAGLLIIPFVSLYTKGVTDINYLIPEYAVVIIVAHAFFCIRTPYVTIVQAAGHYKQTKNGAYMEAGINIVSSIILTYFMGIIGTAIGTLLANIFRTTQYAIYMQKNLLRRSVMVYVKRLIWIIICISLTLTICFKIVMQYAINWENWVLCGIGIVIISSIICILLGFVMFKDDASYAIAILKVVLKKRKKK